MSDYAGLEKLRQLIQPRLDLIREQGRWRSLRTLEPQSGAIDLTHNDYLGLRHDPIFQARAREAAAAWPVGAGASRLLGGEHSIYAEVERAFATWKGAESALYFSSGYAANEALMAALAHSGAVFFSDALNHASLIDGLRLARLQPQQKVIFPHNDWQFLEESLRRSEAPLKLIVTEALFSMDGDFCPLDELRTLCCRYQALLVVDEAHSLGLYGPRGAGFAAACGFPGDAMISVNPCGKAMAAAGAFIAGPRWLRDYLINTARSFIFSTGASPWLAAALGEAIAYVPTLETRRQTLRSQAARMRSELSKLDFDIGPSSSHIIPLITGDEARALHAEEWMRQRGILVRAIRPPTVPEASCRLRLSLHAGLDEAAVDSILLTFKELRYALS